jgi:hypothetical protein
MVVSGTDILTGWIENLPEKFFEVEYKHGKKVKAKSWFFDPTSAASTVTALSQAITFAKQVSKK